MRLQGRTISRLHIAVAVVFSILTVQIFANQAKPLSSKRGAAGDKVVITIGDLKLTAHDVEKILQDLPPQNRRYFSSPIGKMQFAEFLVKAKLLSQEAEKRKLDEREDIQLSLRTFRENLLSREMQEEFMKETQVSDDLAQKYFDDNFAAFEEAKARRIVIRSATTNQFYPDKSPNGAPTDEEAKAKAEEIRKKILGGADFEEMAAKFSDDSTTSGKGGDLGYVRRFSQDSRIMLVPPQLEAIFALKAGEISPVVQTPFGFELFKVEERKSPKLLDVRKDVDAKIKQQKFDEWYKDLKTAAGVEVDENYFGSGRRVASAPSSQK